ncbi:MAG: hypothetical protein ACLTTU_09505 [Bilophila wadsworthia]
MQDRAEEGPRLPFVADERAEYGGWSVFMFMAPAFMVRLPAAKFSRSAQMILPHSCST